MAHTTASLSSAKVVVVIISWAFFLFQTWHFDHFECLKLWSKKGRKTGFLRMMTWSYLIAIPAYGAYEGILAYVKYNVGHKFIPSIGHEVPTPFQLWPAHYVYLVKLSYWILAFCCSCNIITSSEEIAFFWWLLQVQSHKERFFQTWYFRLWILFTLASAAVFPLMVWTGALVNDPNIMERNCYFALSVVQIILAVGTGVILARFPGFIKRNVDQGCKPEVILRLWTFHSLNQIRFVCRLAYCILIIPTTAAIAGDVTISHSVPLTDIFQFIAFIVFALGAAVQLLILFPRSIEAEAGYQIVKMAPRSSHSPPVSAAGTDSTLHSDDSYLGPSASQRGEAFDKRSAHSEMDLMEMDALPRMPRTLEDQKGPHPMIQRYRTPLDIPFDDSDDEDDD